MRVFVISLAQRTDRQEYMRQKLEQVGLEFEIFPAVDGKVLSEQELLQVYDRQGRMDSGHVKDMTLAEIGCALSHLYICKKMLDEGIDVALVLEDDIKFLADFKTVVAGVEQRVELGRPEIYLLNNRIKRYYSRHGVTVAPGYQAYPLFDAFGGYGYILNRAAAEVLYREFFPVRRVADDWRWIAKDRQVNLFGVLPFVVDCRTEIADSSDIEEERRERGDTEIPTSRAYYYLRRHLTKIHYEIYFRLIRGVKKHLEDGPIPRSRFRF